MRIVFFVLTLLLLSVAGWVLWTEANPSWRHYQEVARGRAEARLLDMQTEARAELDRPVMQSLLGSIDARLRTLDADSSDSDRRRDAAGRLVSLRQERVRLGQELRREEARLAAPDLVLKQRVLRSLLAQARDAYATTSAKWPPNEGVLSRWKARRDSLESELAVLLRPVDDLVARIDSLRAIEDTVHVEVDALASPREELLAERERLFTRRTTVESALARVRAQRSGIREIVSPDGGEITRCPTCHGGLLEFPPAHPVLPSEAELVDVPCTVCHHGNGRALDVKRAHEGLVSGIATGGGAYSLQARIDRLQSPDPSTRRTAMEELRALTGIEPPPVETSAGASVGTPFGTIAASIGTSETLAATDASRSLAADDAEAHAWLVWWETAQRYFEASSPGHGADPNQASGGTDPWSIAPTGRPLRYVGSRECLGCHRTLHREHSMRWAKTKFQSMNRLVGEPHPERCYRCHATGYDAVTGTYAEAGVTCEACHGPGEQYSEMMFVGSELNGRGETGRGREILAESSRLAREAVSARLFQTDSGPVNVCVTCHNPRRHRDGGPGILERDSETAAAGSTDEKAVR
ncbi:MAG: multiheme c-type cytochrome [Candidatus Eisenbacteria bacterium]